MSTTPVSPARALKDRVAELKNTINSQYPANAVVDLALHGLDAAIAEADNPTAAKPAAGQGPIPGTGPITAGYPKTLADSTLAHRANIIVDNPGEETSARASGFTKQI